MAEENRKMSKGRKILVGFIVVLFLLTIGAYFFGVYYFTKHFLPGTQVNGFNCSYMTQEETEKLLAEKRIQDVRRMIYSRRALQRK